MQLEITINGKLTNVEVKEINFEEYIDLQGHAAISEVIDGHSRTRIDTAKYIKLLILASTGVRDLKNISVKDGIRLQEAVLELNSFDETFFPEETKQ